MWVAVNEQGQYVKDKASKIVVDNPQEVHNALLHRNRKNLGQAKQTPFAEGQWAQKLKWDGTGDLGNDILSGTILNKERFDSTIQLYFESLQTIRFTGSLKIIAPRLSLEEYKNSEKKKRRRKILVHHRLVYM